MSPLIPYYEFVRSYNESSILKNFKKAWNEYGQGQIISKNKFFSKYLPTTTALIDYFYSNDGTTTPFS